MIHLRPYQAAAIQNAYNRIRAGIPSGLMVIPTGGGKTMTFSIPVRDAVVGTDAQGVKRIKGRAIILAHRDELLTQAADKLLMVAPELRNCVGFVKGKTNDIDAPIIIASVPTLSRPKRLAQLNPDVNLVVVDEAHHAAADGYLRIFEYLNYKYLLGVTATPERADKKKITDIFEEVVFEKSLESMIREKFLVPPKGQRIELEMDLGDVAQRGGDFVANDLARTLDRADAPREVVRSYLQFGEGRKTIVFCPVVAQAHQTALMFQRAGIRAEALDGKTKTLERQAMLRRFQTGETQVLVNCAVLTEGFDEPSVSCLILASPTKSRSLYTQIIGRGLRLHPSKTDCLILDIAGASDHTSIQSLPAFFGINRLLEDEDVIEAMDREKREKEGGGAAEHSEELQRRVVKGRSTRGISFFSRDRLHWIETERGWILDLGKGEVVALYPQDAAKEHWAVVSMRTEERRQYIPHGDGFDIGFATGVADMVIRERGMEFAADRQAKWRLEPPTEGQLNALRKWEVSAQPATRGEASELILIASSGRLFDYLDQNYSSPVASSGLHTAGNQPQVVGVGS